MPFLTDEIPVLVHADGVYELIVDLCYQGNPDSGGDLIAIPAGFKTDLASVPRFLSWLTPIAGVHNRAAILHDWNCVQLARFWRLRYEDEVPRINSNDTDGLFLRCLREAGVHTYRRRAYWVGVRYGALANPARREGWWKTAPQVALWTVLLLPILPGALAAGLTLALGRVIGEAVDTVRWLVTGWMPPVAMTDNDFNRRAFDQRRKP